MVYKRDLYIVIIDFAGQNYLKETGFAPIPGVDEYEVVK